MERSTGMVQYFEGLYQYENKQIREDEAEEHLITTDSKLMN